MKPVLHLVGTIVVLILVYFAIDSGANVQSKSQQTNKPTEIVQNPIQNKWETKIDDQQPVSITITPIELGSESNEWNFKIVFDTHSGSLDDDPLQAVILSDDKGEIYQPTNWEGPGPGGHHREGVLTFKAIKPMPLFVELKIKNIGGISERSLKWNL
ncbi:hypothetical protein HY771_02960 [Candidatus Uhrbacteria bacterium]|nr:hypothetical protein [Candidatus Uhrbacteria bacterium]MBI4812478.1 hypothetical protein [Candidatus Falkowbacteria bacterium]